MRKTSNIIKSKFTTPALITVIVILITLTLAAGIASLTAIYNESAVIESNAMLLHFGIVATLLLAVITLTWTWRTIRKINEVTESEHAIQELYTAFVEAAPFVIALWDESSKNPIWVSKQAKEFFGIDDVSLITDNLFSISPEMQPCGTPTAEKAIEMVNKTYELGTHQFEWLHHKSDGTLIPTKCVFKHVQIDGKDKLISFTIDFTEIKAAEKLAETVLSNAPLFIEIYNFDGVALDCNKKMLKVFEVSDKAEFLSRIYDYFPEYQPCGTLSVDRHKKMMELTLTQGVSHSEWMYILPSGEELPTESTWTYTTYGGAPAVIVYSHDLRQITASLAREQSLESKLREKELNNRIEIAEESSRVKTQFLARMSHEIRTPITAVLGISEIQLQAPNLPPNIEESFSKIHDSGSMLLDIINDILDISKIEAGKVSLVCDAYSIASFISDTVQPYTIRQEHRCIDFHMSVDENLPRVLYGDALRIKQIVHNLLSNAFKYTEKGSVKLSFKCQSDSIGNILGDKTAFVITVSDTGLGMTKEQVDSLYSEYTRFHEHSANFASGTGLGMSIVMDLLELMDGTITVDSETEAGTSVAICIPQRVVDFELLGSRLAESLQKFEADLQPVNKKFSFKPEYMPYGRVLVVDDVNTNLFVAKGLLELYGLNIETCTSGYAAIDKIKQGNVYDIVFMDQMMPGMDGVETLHAMRDMGYTGIITVLTANAVIGQSDKFIEYGFDGVLSKPIIPLHLNSVLVKQIRDKQPPEVIEAARASKPGNQKDSDTDGETKAAGLLSRLTPLLESHDGKCTDLLEELSEIPGTGVLLRQIEEFDFEEALKTVRKLVD